MIDLPYHFDTSRVWRSILSGAFAVEAVILVSILYGASVKREPAIVLALALSGVMLAYFIRRFLRFQTGSVGTITPDHVIIQPNTLYGLRLPGPHGEYATSRFSAVRLELMSGPIGHTDVLVHGGPHERIWLVGHDGVPDILIARTQQEGGRALATGLGAALAVPVEERRRPY